MIRLISYIIKNVKLNKYYYFKNNKFENITLIVYFLNLLFINNRIKNYIFNNNIFVVSDYKIWKLNCIRENFVRSKILKRLIYKDNCYKIELPKLKNNIYIIDDNISIDFLLKYFYNIDRHIDSFIIIDYFKYSTKVLKIKFESTIKDLY